MAAAAPSPYRGAHGAGQRKGNRFVGQHVFHTHRCLVLGQGVQGTVPVVLGTDGRQLALGAAKTAHVPFGPHGIGVHEDAASVSGRRLVRRDLQREGLVEVHHHLDVVLEIIHIHAGGIGGQGFHFVRVGDFLGTHRQRHVSHLRPNGGIGQVQGGGGAGAGIFHIGHRNGVDSHRTQHNLSANGMLVGEHAPEGVGKIGRLERRLVEAGIFQRQVCHLVGHIPDRAVRIFVESDHTESDDIDIGHRSVSFRVG